MTVPAAFRARETSTTTGTGTYTLAGPVAGFQTLVAAAIEIEGGAGPWLVHAIITDGTDWESGVYTLTDAASDTLARTTIVASSNGDAAVNWGSGTKQVFIWPDALRMARLLDDDKGRGFMVRPASGQYGVARLVAGAGVTIANGSGNTVGGSVANPTISINASSFPGSSLAAAAAMLAGDLFVFIDKSDGTTKQVPMSGALKANGGIIARASVGLAFEVSALGASTGAVATSDLIPVQTPGSPPRFERGSLFGGLIDQQAFDASGTWNKPTGGTYALVECWGGGGSGGSTNTTDSSGGGAGGGAYSAAWFLLSDLGSSETVTIGAGGAGVSGALDGNAGGDTTFGSHVTAYGGGGGAYVGGSFGGGGGGGGVLSAGTTATTADGAAGGSPDGGATQSTINADGNPSGFGGGSGGRGTGQGGHGGHGGAGGGGATSSGTAGGGGNSFMGGAGGGGGATTGTAGSAGTSVGGGAGGTGGNNTTNPTSGAQPGGGGGGASNNRTSGAGGAGRVRVTVW